MKLFLAAVLVSCIGAGVANLVLTRGFQVTAESAYAARSARP